MKKQLICLMLAVGMLLSMCNITAYAAMGTSNYDEQSAITLVKTLNIMVGDGQGNMNLGNYVSRAEFTKIAVAMSSYRNMVAATSTTSMFRDCSFKHWAAPYVRVAVTNGMFTGYPDGTFRPDNTVTLEEAVTVMLKLLGYTNDDFGSSWPYGQIGIAKNEHILDNVTKNVGDSLTRADVLKIVYNTLIAKPKTAQNADAKYLEQLECYLYEGAVIIATNEQNNSVSPGYVMTDVGTFKIGSDFNMSFVGRKGDLIIKNNDFAAFMQSEQKVEKHVVYSKLNDSLITYYNGSMTNFTMDSDVTAYKDAGKTTYNAVSNTISTGDTIYIMKDASGKTEYLTIVTDNIQGPFTVSGSNWYGKFTADPSALTVMYNGVKSAYTDVKTNDIVYYISDINTVFSYSKRITGVYEKATPNKDMPTSVTVSGVEYMLESVAAFDKVSSNGDFKYGDTITLLMGKDGMVADVVSAEVAQATMAGYLIGTGTKEFTNSDGDVYTSLYAQLVCTDGSILEVATDNNYDDDINRVMAVSYSNGTAKLSVALNTEKVSGTVNSKKMTIGSDEISDSVNILDVTNYGDDENAGAYMTTYMQRLDGAVIQADSVLYAKAGDDGKITDLILDNVTGDNYEYGIITDVTESGSGVGMSVKNRRYTCDIAGKEYICNVNYGSQFRKTMAAAFELSGGSVTSMVALNKLTASVSQINDGSIVCGGVEYDLSDKVAVYKVTVGGENSYTVLPLNQLKENLEDYTVTAYYDKHKVNGGRIRVLVAVTK